jgi:NADH:ubiquinone oxidoreductase subunit 3 (subunit A)
LAVHDLVYEEKPVEIILAPPIAFLIYLPLVGLITLLGKGLAGPEKSDPVKSSTYGSGEAAPTNLAAPGYRPFFLVAFFFAILHLGMLVLGSGTLANISPLYVVGLLFALAALVLG